MTGRFRFGKISIGMRVRARIEHKATPITRTITEMGLRRALRRSHMFISLLKHYCAAIPEMARDHLEPPPPMRSFARPPGVRGHRQFRPEREGSARPKHRRGLPALPDNEHVPEFRWSEPRRVVVACSPLLSARHRARLAPCGVAPSSLAALGRTALLPRVRSPLQLPFST